MVEPPPPPGERCGRCGRFLKTDFACYRDQRLGVDFCLPCIAAILDDKLGLTFVPAYRPRGRS